MSRQAKGKPRRKDKSEGSLSLLEEDVTGVVKFFDVEDGYGFIYGNPVGDVFFHRSHLVSDNPRWYQRNTKKGDEVSFDLWRGPKGYVARRVRVTHEAPYYEDDDEEYDDFEGDDDFYPFD